jgi:hypothetical protein
MISADPTIPHPDNLQAYSRYAYVYNDPLNRWDPSGYKPKWKKIGLFLAFGVVGVVSKEERQMILGIAAAFVTQQWYLANAFVGGSVAAGALGGFTGGLVASGGVSAKDIDYIAPAILPDCFFFERRPDA